jgi:hypothetical protein
MTLPAYKVNFESLTSGARWNPSLCGPHLALLVSDSKLVTLPAHKVTEFESLTSGVTWGPHNEGFHLTLLVSDTKSVTLWAGKVTEAQSVILKVLHRELYETAEPS